MDTSRSRRFGVGSYLLAAFLAALVPAPRPARAATKRLLIQKRCFRVISGASVSVTFKRPTTAGNLIVAYVVWDNAGSVSVTDSAGDIFASAIGPTQATGDPSSAQIFYATHIAGGRDTVTASFATGISARGVLYVHEYAGLDRSAPLEGAVAASGSPLTMDSGVLTTAGAGDLLFAGAESNGKSIGRLTRGFKKRLGKYGNATAEEARAAAGPHEITATQNGTAWVMQLVAFRTAGSTPPNTAYPLKVGPTGRYLVDQQGVPFLITGDSPQSLMVNLSEAEADSFFADRQEAGFNAVWINLLCATYTGGRPDGSTYDGIVPFTTDGNLSTPNEAYFARVDDMLALAAKHGLTVFLDPAETGSWLSVLSSNGVTKSRDLRAVPG